MTDDDWAGGAHKAPAHFSATCQIAECAPDGRGDDEAGKVGAAEWRGRAEVLESENASLERRLKLALADYDNFRKRTEAQRAENAQEEKKRMSLDLLEVLDNFQRALDAVGKDVPQEWVSGLDAARRQFLEILQRHGLTQVEALHRRFDPRFHEVLDVVSSPFFADMEVVHVYQEGFLFNGRLLRPARVRVVQRGEEGRAEPRSGIDERA